jgi:hypothetical protein
MSWLRLKDLVVSTSANNNKMLGLGSSNTVVAVTAEDMVEKAISSSTTVQNAFNTQTANAIQNDNSVQQVFNSQVGDAIQNDNSVNNIFNSQVTNAVTNDPGTQAAMNTQITQVNNNPTTTVTYTNPPTVNGQPLLPLPTSSRAGEHLIYGAAGSTQVNNKKLVVKASSAARTTFVNQAQGQAVIQLNASFQDILDNFYRFSHKDGSDHANVGNEQGWSTDANGNLTQPINTDNALGFASQQLYDKFEGTILVRSSDSDNDLMGFVLALCQQDQNGNNIPDETISVVRTNEMGGHTLAGGSLSTDRFAIVYNLEKNGEKILASNGAGVTGNAWSSPYPNGDAIKFRRTADLLEVWLVQNVASPPTFNDASWGNYISVDLTVANNGVSAATLAKFRQPARWGLIAASQGFCSWKDLTLDGGPAQLANTGTSKMNPQPDPDINKFVFDLESNTTYAYQNGTWVADTSGATIHDYVTDGQILYDTSDKAVYIKEDNSLQLLTTMRRHTLQLSANYTLKASDLGKLIVANPGCGTITINDQYGEGWHCKILNKTNASLKIDSGGAANQGSRFGDRGLSMNNTSFQLPNSHVLTLWGNGHNDGKNLHPEIATSHYGA